MTVAAHHQQICTEAAAFCDQNVGAVVFLADGAIFDGIDAMMPEVQHRIIGLQRVRGLVLAFHSENANFFRLTQKGEGFGHRARRTRGFRSTPQRRCRAAPGQSSGARNK